MAKKKSTRRSVSLKGITYQRIKNYCHARELSVSGWLEDLVAERLDASGEPNRKAPERELQRFFGR